MEALYATIFGSAFTLFCMLVCNLPATIKEGLVSIGTREE